VTLGACALLPAISNGQSSPTASPSPSTATVAISPKGAAPAPSPSPARPPTREELIDSLTAADLQTALTALKKNFTNSEAVDETQVNRATLLGLIVRLNKGLLLLPAKEGVPAESPAPLYAEVLDGHIGYLRAGAMSAANVQALDKRVADFAAKKVDALVIDLRASDSGDFASAAEFAKRFVPKGKTLFSLRKQDKQDHAFV